MQVVGFALLFGLGARILLDLFTRPTPNVIRDGILLGLWQGVALHLVYTQHPESGIGFALAILGKLAVEQSVFEVESIKSICALVGVALGAVGTDVLSHLVDDSTRPKPSRRHKSRSHRHHKKIPLQPPASAGSQSLRDRAFQHHLADITSVDSNSDMIGPNNPLMTPIEREVAALRARASLADSERRRYKEEKKWAIEQGNTARASQMSWQVKRYTALMQSFHRQADAQIIEATDARSRQLQGAIDKSQQRQAARTRDYSNDHQPSIQLVMETPVQTQSRQTGQIRPTMRTNVR